MAESSKPVTTYALKDEHEFFAENFAAYVLMPQQLKESAPDGYEMVQSVLTEMGIGARQNLPILKRAVGAVARPHLCRHTVSQIGKVKPLRQRAKKKRKPSAASTAAEQSQPKIRQAFLDWIASVKASLPLKELEAAIANRNMPSVLSYLDLQHRMEQAARGAGLPPHKASFQDALQRTFQAGMDAEYRALAPVRIRVGQAPRAVRKQEHHPPAETIGTALALDRVNQAGIDFLNQYAGDLIRQVSADTLAAIQKIITDGYAAGDAPAVMAREVRNVIGLTDTQAQAVSNFSDMLNSMEESRLREAMTRALRDQRFDPSIEAAIDGTRELDPDKIDAMVDRYYERYLSYRAETISRTESLRASNAGQANLWDQARAQGLLDVDRTRKVWIGGECEYCQDMEDTYGDEGIPLDDEFDSELGSVDEPPLHPNCLLRDARVLAEGISATSVRQFDGDILVFRTASDKQLACTVNHPILTDHGWVPAQFIKIGNHVVSSARPEWDRSSGMDHEDMPAMIQEIADAFRSISGVATMPVPVDTKDFHIDGEGGKIAVIRANGFLGDSRYAALHKQLGKKNFLATLRWLRIALMALRSQGQILRRTLTASYSSMSGFDFALAFCGAQLRCMQDCGFTSASRLDASFFQPIRDEAASHIETVRDAIHGMAGFEKLYNCINRNNRSLGSPMAYSHFWRHPAAHQGPVDRVEVDSQLAADLISGKAGPVFIDNVIDIGCRHVSSHVYNLQTKSGAYEANGIITHNCTCTTGLIFIGADGQEEEE